MGAQVTYYTHDKDAIVHVVVSALNEGYRMQTNVTIDTEPPIPIRIELLMPGGDIKVSDQTGVLDMCSWDEFHEYMDYWDPSTQWARGTSTSASGRLNFSSAHPSTNWTNISSPNYNGQDLQDAMVILTDAIVDATVPWVGIQHNTVDLGPRLGSFCFVVDMNGQIEFEGSNIRYHAHEVMDLINHRPNDLLQEMIAARNVGNKTVVPAFKREFDASQDSKGHVCEPGMTKIFGKDICKICGVDL